ncbi:hypothetical protein ACPCBC_32075 [Streptomyces incarnatus]
MCAAAPATTGCSGSGHPGTASPPPAHATLITAPPAPTPHAPSVHHAPLTGSDGVKVLASGTAVRGDATGSLRLTADPGVAWSFALGWDPNPPERR